MTARISDLTNLQPSRPAALTIGVFDGVHRGHQELIKETINRARAVDGESIVLTFYPHPRTVLRPDSPISELTNLRERTNLIAALGVDVVATLPFTHELALLSAEEFIDMLMQHVALRELCVGPDFALGRGRAGTVSVLTEIGARRGFRVNSIPHVVVGGERVSSSRVRALVAAGDVEQAAQLLGRPVLIEGAVVTGVQRGRTLGFATANLAPSASLLLPANGIYAVYAELDGNKLPAVANIGVRPTFGHNARLVEVHILDFDRSIYGAHLRVHLVKRLRDELRFSSVDALVAQMHRDVAAARSVLAPDNAAARG